jgi:hypothetical protein
MNEAACSQTRDENNGSGATRTLTRERLYALIWETPMTKLAKTFGLSDVGLRKICVKHDIPTPPPGYWARLAHGKPVRKPSLPRAEDGADTIHLIARTGPLMPPVVAQQQDAALAKETQHPKIAVPAERPATFHPVAIATAKGLHAAKTDYEGFKHAQAREGVAVSLAPTSIDRALRIIDAFARAAEARGHRLTASEGGVDIIVDDVPVSWRVYEVKGRAAHQPTEKERKEQARREEDRARWPSFYSSDSKAYRSWDYFPSGKLSMMLTDGTRYRSGRDGLIGHWYDRKGKSLEEYLDDAMAALATGAVAIKHRLALEAEKQRREEEARAARRREASRRERAHRRYDFLLRKAEEYARFEKLSAFATFMERSVYSYRDEPADRLIRELKSLIKVMGENLARDTLNEEIARAHLYTADDPVIGPYD